MNRSITYLVVLILIPCLIADRAIASFNDPAALTTARTVFSDIRGNVGIFARQAVAPPELVSPRLVSPDESDHRAELLRDIKPAAPELKKAINLATQKIDLETRAVVERLSINDARKVLLQDYRALTSEYLHLAELCEQAAHALRKDGLASVQSHWLSQIEQATTQIDRRVDRIATLRALTGFVEEDMRAVLDPFLMNLSNQFHADRAIVWFGGLGGAHFMYGRGLTAAQLCHLDNSIGAIYEHTYGRLKDDPNPEIIQQGKEILRESGLESYVYALPSDETWETDENQFIVVVLGRSPAMIQLDGEFKMDDREHLESVLDGQVRSNTAVWPRIREEMHRRGYNQFDNYMTLIKHDGSVGRWRQVISPDQHKFLHILKQNNPNKTIEDLEHNFVGMASAAKDFAADDAVFIHLLGAGETFEAADIFPIIEQKTNQYRHKITEKGLQLTMKIDAPQSYISTVDTRLLGILMDNLLSNALKYTDQGSITIELGRGEFPSMSGRPPGPAIVLKVSDTGIGIPAKDLSKIFSKSYRAANIGTRPGDGIGLYLVYMIANLMGGAVTAESKNKTGATLTIYFPEYKEPVTPTEANPIRQIDMTEGLFRTLEDVLHEQGVESVFVSFVSVSTGRQLTRLNYTDDSRATERMRSYYALGFQEACAEIRSDRAVMAATGYRIHVSLGTVPGHRDVSIDVLDSKTSPFDLAENVPKSIFGTLVYTPDEQASVLIMGRPLAGKTSLGTALMDTYGYGYGFGHDSRVQLLWKNGRFYAAPDGEPPNDVSLGTLKETRLKEIHHRTNRWAKIKAIIWLDDVRGLAGPLPRQVDAYSNPALVAEKLSENQFAEDHEINYFNISMPVPSTDEHIIEAARWLNKQLSSKSPSAHTANPSHEERLGGAA